MRFVHERGPHWRSKDSALRVRFDFLWFVEAHPDAGHEIRCVTDKPRVSAVVGRSCFSAGRKANLAAHAARGRSALHDVLHDADHQPRFFWR